MSDNDDQQAEANGSSLNTTQADFAGSSKRRSSKSAQTVWAISIWLNDKRKIAASIERDDFGNGDGDVKTTGRRGETIYKCYEYVCTHSKSAARDLASLLRTNRLVIGEYSTAPAPTSLTNDVVLEILHQVVSPEYIGTIWIDNAFAFTADRAPSGVFDWDDFFRTRRAPVSPKTLLRLGRSLYAHLVRNRENYQKQNEGVLPDLSMLSVDLKHVREIERSELLTPPQHDSLQTLIALGEWALLNGPAIQRSQAATEKQKATTNPTKRVPTVSEISGWPPKDFFAWFDRAIVDIPRKELLKPVRAWLKAQEGRHDFSELSPANALKTKQDLARRVNDVIDSLGLSLICGKEGCGHRARLGAARMGSSVSGQFTFAHPGETPRSTYRHAASKFFPHLTIE